MKHRLPTAVEMDDLRGNRSSAFEGFFGVVLPVLALVIELGTGILGDGYFDPIPAPHYALLIALVPATVAWCLWGSAPTPRARAARSLALGAATTVALVYSLAFAPGVPFWFIGVVFGGLGLLPLSPMTSALTLVALARRACKRGTFHWRPAALGAGVALVLLAHDWLGQRVTCSLVDRAGSAERSEQLAALRWLRLVGNEDVLARIATGDPIAAFPYFLGRLSSIEHPIERHSYESAAALFHSVTGRAPSDEFGDGRMFDVVDPGTWQARNSSRRAMRPISELFLESSEFEGVVDVPAAVAYLEWTLEVGARRFGPYEAQLHVRLPQDAVVSRATLWVEGSPREATFTKRESARAVYDGIVNKRMDPLLVSQVAPDEVLVEVFPVMGGQEARRLRLGLTVPLRSLRAHELSFALPLVLDHNCGTSLDGHAVRLEALGGELAVGDALLRDPQVTERAVWAGRLADAALDAQVIRVLGAPAPLAWALGPRATPEDDVVVQEAVEIDDSSTNAVVIVLDGGRAMRRARRDFDEMLASWPANLPFAAFFAGDEVVELAPIGPATPERRAAAQAALERVEFAGGIDAAPALAAGLGVARGIGPDARVLWIHGTQAVLDPRSRALWSAFTDEDRARITALDLAGLGSVLMDEVGREGSGIGSGSPRFVGDTSDSGLVARVERWLAAGARSKAQPAVVRTIVAADSELAVQARVASPTPASDHVLRLAVAETVARAWRESDGEARAHASALAVDAQLVTALTSALVLESDAMTTAAGLELPREDVPVLPEPELALLLVVALAALGARALVLRRAQSAARGGVAV